jgi:hypothetical protein
MSWQDPYVAPAPTTQAGEYSTQPPEYGPTNTQPAGENYYQNGFITITTTATTPDISAIQNICLFDRQMGFAHDQEAIISLGVVCGLLIIGLAILIFLFFCRGGEKQKKLEGEVVISSGYHGRHEHRRDRTAYSRGATDDMTEYPYEPRKHRSNRRSHPVRNEDFAGIQGVGCSPGQWGAAGVQLPPGAYTRYAGAPLFCQTGPGNETGVPAVQAPTPPQAPVPQGGLDGGFQGVVNELSESSSSSHTETPGRRHSSVRRHHSRTSSSHGGRSGRG